MASPTATNGLAVTLDKARDLLSNTSAWQTWTGTASAATAKARTYLIGAPSTATRPFALIDFEERAYTKIGESSYRLDGDIIFYFEDDVTADYVDSHTDAWMEFLNSLGAVEAGIKGLSGTGAYQDYSRIAVTPQDLGRIDKEDRQGGHTDIIFGVIRCRYWGG